jgi:hypothetical protein
MMLDNHVAFSGYLARLSEEISPKNLFFGKLDVANLQTIGSSNWQAFSWKPQDAIVTSNSPGRAISRSTEHTFLFRQSGDRFVILSDQARMADHLLKSFGSARNIEFPIVQVQAIVDGLLTDESDSVRKYRLCSLFASRSSSTALKTIGVWGDDISNDDFFGRVIAEVTPYRIGLGDIAGSKEIASIGSGGELSFFFRNATQLRNVDRLISALTAHGHIKWSNFP